MGRAGKKIDVFRWSNTDGSKRLSLDIRLIRHEGIEQFVIRDPDSDCQSVSPNINTVQLDMKKRLETFYSITFEPYLLVLFSYEASKTDETKMELSYQEIELSPNREKEGGRKYRKPGERYFSIIDENELGVQNRYSNENEKIVRCLVVNNEANKSALERFISVLANVSKELMKFLTPETIEKTLQFKDFRKMLGAPAPEPKLEKKKKHENAPDSLDL